MAIGIFIFHFCYNSPAQINLGIGHLLVGGFFMLSGFGLMESFKNKKNYLDDFIGKKTARLLVPVWIAGLIVILIQLTAYSNYLILKNRVYLFDLISGGITLTTTWFVVELIFFYIVFYLAFKYLNKRLAIIAVSVSVLFLMILLSLQQHNMWYASGMMFPVGLILSYYKDTIESLNPNIILILGLIISLTFACVVKLPEITPLSSMFNGNLQCLLITLFIVISLLIKKNNVNKWLLTLLISNIIYCTFGVLLQFELVVFAELPIITILLIISSLNVLHPLTDFFGDVSYEFYIIHVTMIKFSNLWNSNVWLCLIFSLILSLIIAIVIRKASGILLNNKKREKYPTG